MTYIGDPLPGRRRKPGTYADCDARDRHRHRRSQRREGLAGTARGGLAHALDECHRVGQRNRPRPWTVHVTSDRPRPFVVIRVRRKTVSEIDAPAIENVAAGGDRDEHRRIAVLGDADGRGSLRSCSRHPVLLGR